MTGRIFFFVMTLVGTGACVFEGGGCTGPFCFSVATDDCDYGTNCYLDRSGSCPDADDIERQSVSWLNNVRARGVSCSATAAPAVGALQWSFSEFSAADRHSIDMAGNNFVAQTGTDGLGVSERLTSAGEFSFVGQAVAGGFTSVESVLDAWVEQPADCALLMQSAATKFGLACRYDNDSDYGQYWTLVMSDRQ